MARLHTAKASKDYPEEGIKKGDTYYWWSLRPGGRGKGIKYRSKTRPPQSALTSNAFEGARLALAEQLASEELTPDDVESIISDIEALRDEQEEKRNNMPEQLQDAPSGELLQERYDQLEEWINQLQAVDAPEEVTEDEIVDSDLDDDEEYDPEDFEIDEDASEEEVAKNDAAREEARAAAVKRVVEAKNAENLNNWREEIRNCAE